MNNQPPFPEPPHNEASANLPAQDDFKPWEQRAAPGGGGGGGAPAPDADGIESYARNVQVADRERMQELVNQQTDFVHLTRLDQHTTPQTDLEFKAESNEDAWKQFNQEQLYNTRRVTLEYFHLFEWFPLAPGKFHTAQAASSRTAAEQFRIRSGDGSFYYSPEGKGMMLEGGIGAVRLRPTGIGGQDYYFMSASSNGVCHEGFPVLVPQEFYGQLKQRMLADGAVPVVMSGEMKYVPKDAVSFFGNAREFPQLYLHVDNVKILPKPRSEITRFYVSVAVSFRGEVEGQRGEFVTYCTFDPASHSSFQEAIDWIDKFYVRGQYKGTVITDFDDAYPHFPDAVFALPALRSGTLDLDKVNEFLKANGMGQAGNQFIVLYNDYRQIIRGDLVMGDKVMGDKITIGAITNSTGITVGRNSAPPVTPP